MKNQTNPVVLCILDGWGVSNNKNQYNAISQANTNCWNSLLESYPNTILQCSGEHVGLPKGQMGNSEVGHTIIGSGRLVLQDLVRINQQIENDSLKNNSILRNLINLHKKNGKTIHLLGLCSDGGVHSHIDHLVYLVELLANNGIELRLHLFLDGRDVAPRSAEKYLNEIQILLDKYQNVNIATLAGRYYSMDRDLRNERTKLSSDAIIFGKGPSFENWQNYLKIQHEAGNSDEFMVPYSLNEYKGIEEEDSILFFNFRSDRIRQLANYLLASPIRYGLKIGMTHYSDDLSEKLETLFPEQKVKNSLGEWLSLHECKQLRIAETEKYAHVTFFFSGGNEKLFLGEERILVPSPKVKTYDLKPEMSAFEVTNSVLKAIREGEYSFIVVNYANPDMVGHTGNFDAAVKAVEAVDECLKALSDEILKYNGVLVITADHGNVEYMYDADNKICHTAHTINPVPLVLVSDKFKFSNIKLLEGNLADIAPTILKIMNLPQPSEMTGKPIF